MITRILERRASCRSVLDYNETKVLEGEAEHVRAHNIDNVCTAAIYDTLERFESNPAAAQQLRWRSFHMAVNPAPEDNMGEETVLDYIDEVMRELGYGEQPYVVYRHNDIERVHYHVASVRVMKDGKAVPIGNDAFKVQAIQRRLSAKYGFTVGRQMPIPEREAVAANVREFRKGTSNVMNTLSALFMKALQYEFHSQYQFNCILRSMNIGANTRERKDGGSNYILHGVDENGKTCTRYYSLERHMKIQGVEPFNQRLEQNNAIGVLRSSGKEQLLEMSDYCLEHSGSLSEYKSMLAELGVTAAVLRDTKTGDIRRVTLVEKRNMAMVDSAVSGELYGKAFSEAEKGGRWLRETGGKAASTKAVATRRKFFDDRRIAELNARIRARIEAFGGSVPAQAQTRRGGARLK